MPRWIRRVACVTAVALLAPASATAELFLSEYIEGSSFNKAIEIYNPGKSPVDLSDYELRLYSNGAASPTQTATLSGMLASGDVFVAAHPSANAAILAVADMTSSAVINFNGDDAFELYKISTASSLDVIGQIGVDPGSEWAGSGVSTLNQTITRKPDVCVGDGNGGDVFDPSIEWDGHAVDTFDQLGAHTSTCGPTPARPTTWGRVKALYR